MIGLSSAWTIKEEGNRKDEQGNEQSNEKETPIYANRSGAYNNGYYANN